MEVWWSHGGGGDKPWIMQYNGLQHYIFAVFYDCYSNLCWEDISYTPALS